TKWQYSNTNYVIAGMIVEKITGEPLFSFVRKHILEPLQMKSATNTDEAALGPDDPQRYLRYAGGPLRVAPKEGAGWMFAAGELAMTASDLAKWDISLMNESLLPLASYREMETEVRLTNGVGTGYGLGVGLALANGRRRVSHSGEVSGFTAENDVFPDDHVAVAVLTNMDATGASHDIASKIEEIVFAQSEPGMTAALEKMKGIFAGLQHGQIDRSLFTANANAYFDKQAIADFAATLGPLGEPKSFEQTAQGLRGGMTLRRYTIKFPNKTLRLTTFIMSTGKIEQYQIAPSE
ncbi:MAG TPA: serine hydrolase domain-containing protein, partial [Chthoniobacterales bacterium]